mgnify:CR=1 FL=1
MKNRIKENTYRMLAVISFIGLYATMGGIEFETISIGRGIVQAIAFIAAMVMCNNAAEKEHRKAKGVRRNG